MVALLRTLESSENSGAWGIMVLRVLVGFAFFMHGWQKVFEFGIPGVEQGFAQMAVPLPSLTAPLVSLLELVGGIALIVGLGTRWIAIPLAINMLAAMALVHWRGGFFIPDGVELVLLLFGALLTLILAAPGALALDSLVVRLAQGSAVEAVSALRAGTNESPRTAPGDQRRPAA